MVFNPEAIERSCQDFVGRLIKSDILIKNKHNLSQRGGRNASRWRRVGGLFPFISDGTAPRKTSKTSLKGTRMYDNSIGASFRLKHLTRYKFTSYKARIVPLPFL